MAKSAGGKKQLKGARPKNKGLEPSKLKNEKTDAGELTPSQEGKTEHPKAEKRGGELTPSPKGVKNEHKNRAESVKPET